MGQQQLLLIILVTIVVGIATVVAVNTFSVAAERANQDAVQTNLRSMANFAMTYYEKPQMLDGGNKGYDGITFEGFAIPGEIENDEGTEFTNENATYTITARSGDLLTIEGEPAYEDNPTYQITNEDGDGYDDFTVSEVEEE